MKLNTETGSFFNHLMSANNSIPEVGKGATILHWTDRSAYEVIEVSEDKKRCVIQRYDPERLDNFGMSDDQVYKYENLTGETHTLVFRNGSWRFEKEQIVFTTDFRAMAEAHGLGFCCFFLTEEQKDLVYGVEREPFPVNVVPGITHKQMVYPKVNILFGSKQEYYDFTF